MKSFLLVRSQSQISTDNRLSLSASFRWLEERKRKGMVLSWKLFPHHRVPPYAPQEHGCKGKGWSSRPAEVSEI